MPPNVLSWLQGLDQLGWDEPPEYNYYEALGEVAWRRPMFERLLGTGLDLDVKVENAFYVTELALLDESPLDPAEGVTVIAPQIALRFSKFDRMVTVYGSDEAAFEPRMAAVYEELERAAYAFVWHEYLREPYDGVHANQRHTEGWTWFTRFFGSLGKRSASG
jgi:hypothetical protein